MLHPSFPPCRSVEYTRVFKLEICDFKHTSLARVCFCGTCFMLLTLASCCCRLLILLPLAHSTAASTLQHMHCTGWCTASSWPRDHRPCLEQQGAAHPSNVHCSGHSSGVGPEETTTCHHAARRNQVCTHQKALSHIKTRSHTSKRALTHKKTPSHTHTPMRHHTSNAPSHSPTYALPCHPL